MLGQFPSAPAAGAFAPPGGAWVGELPSEFIPEVEPEPADGVLEVEPDVSLVCA